MFDSAFADSLSNALSADIPKPKTGPGMFAGTGSALLNAPAAGFFDVMSALSPVLDIYGKSAAFAQGASKESSISRIGENEMGREMRAQTKRLTPDPTATGEAAQILFGVGRVMTKAGAFALTGGLPAAALGTGGVEGVVEGQTLMDEGVDTATALKVGAVKGVSTAVQIALPMSAATKLGTAGLVVAGGPAGFMAEAAASRYILEHADYKEIARRYDPFDPVGLAVSTLMAGTFGAAGHVVRGRAVAKAEAAKAEQQATSEAAAPWFEVTPEMQAAARVHQMAEHVQDTGLYRPGDLAGARLHIEALESTRAAIDAGDRVEVTGVMPEAARLKPALEAYAQEAGRARAVEATRAELIAEASGRADRGVVAEIDAARPALEQSLAELDASFKDRAKAAQESGLSRKQAETAARKEIADAKTELQGQLGRMDQQLEANRSAAKAEQDLAALDSGDIPEHIQARIDERIAQVREGVTPTPIASALARMFPVEQVHGALKAEGLPATPEHVAAVDLIAQARSLDPARVDAVPETMPTTDYLAHMKGIIDEHPTATPGRADTGGKAPGNQGPEAVASKPATGTEAPRGQAGAGESAGKAAGEVDATDVAAKQAVEAAPDAMVPDPETGLLVAARQLLADAEAVFQNHVVESRAYQAAVTCFLRH